VKIVAVENRVSQQDSEKLTELITSPGFDKLNDDLKGQALSAFQQTKANQAEKETGVLGRLFGNRSENISLYIAFIISIALIIVGLIYICIPQSYKQNTNLEFWQIIGPIITGALGYIFGAGSRK